jgi:MFS family permease
MQEPEAQTYRRTLGLHYMKTPLQNPNFRKLIGFLVSWNFAINLAAPFFTVYMLTTLNYDMIFVVAITLMSQMINAFSLRVWGKYSDRYSNKTILGICGSLFIFCIFCWTFTTFPDKHIYTTHLLIILHVMMGISMSGVSLSTANIAMKLTPSRYATSYLATNTILTSLAAGIAPLFGGLFADYFEDKILSLDFVWQDSSHEIAFHTLNIQHWDFFFMLAAILGLYALHRLALVEEEGSVHENVVIREIMVDTGKILKSLSTVSGLREMTMVPMAIMVNRFKGKHNWRKD